MPKSVRGLIVVAVSVFALIAVTQVMLENYVEARAGGGRTGGFRGSRTYQSPTRPSQPSPSQPQRQATPPTQQPGPIGPQPGGFMRGLGTALLGGFLGSMLFSGLANAGWGGFGGTGFGMIEILLLAGLGYFILQKFRGSAAATAYGTTQYQTDQAYGTGNVGVQEPQASNDVDYRTLTMMDRNFDPNQFLKTTQDMFFRIQGAWNKQDIATLSSLCRAELMQTWQEELSGQRARGQQNRMENIALRESDITEAWTESGEDFITVRLKANLLDYTIEEKSGAVVSGSNSEPIDFEEYWTFSRPVGPNSWKLAAVQQA
jgi:predicted lipid-binding transport protein (Tim44 family)